MFRVKYIPAFADYNCGSYGAGDYNGACSSGSLANTGYDILLPILLGAALVIAGGILLVRRWLRKKRSAKSFEAASTPKN
jgi:hypothetical protein